MSSSPAAPTTVVLVPAGDGVYYYRRTSEDWDSASISFVVFFGVFACLLLSCVVGDYAVSQRENKRASRSRYDEEC